MLHVLYPVDNSSASSIVCMTNTFQLKRYYSLFIYVHNKREQKKSSPVIKFTILPFDIIIWE